MSLVRIWILRVLSVLSAAMIVSHFSYHLSRMTIYLFFHNGKYTLPIVLLIAAQVFISCSFCGSDLRKNFVIHQCLAFMVVILLRLIGILQQILMPFPLPDMIAVILGEQPGIWALHGAVQLCCMAGIMAFWRIRNRQTA